MLIVPNGVTLDLNGKTLTATYVAVYGCIIDSSEGSTGLLATSKDAFMVQNNEAEHAHTYMPVYNEEGTGYIFVQMRAQIQNVVSSNGGTTITFEFRPGLISGDVTEAYFGDGASDNGLSFEVHATWNGSDNDNKMAITEDLIKNVYTNDLMIAFTLDGISTEITDLTISVVIVSVTGVAISAVAYPPANA